jgi:hypothetical protein
MQTMDTNQADPTEVVEPTTDPVAPATEVEPQATETPDGSPQNENYKSYVKRLETQNKSLRSQVLDNHISDIGLNPATGLGVAVREAFSGDDYTLEAVSVFAETKYGHVAQAPEPTQVTEVRQAQTSVDGVAQQTVPVVPVNPMSENLVGLENAMNAEDGTQQDAANSLTAKVAAYREQNPM